MALIPQRTYKQEMYQQQQPATSGFTPDVQQVTHPLFTITKEEVTTGGPFVIAGYSLLAILIIALVFEIMRRVFYYVVLGGFRPEK